MFDEKDGETSRLLALSSPTSTSISSSPFVSPRMLVMISLLPVVFFAVFVCFLHRYSRPHRLKLIRKAINESKVIMARELLVEAATDDDYKVVRLVCNSHPDFLRREMTGGRQGAHSQETMSSEQPTIGEREFKDAEDNDGKHRPTPPSPPPRQQQTLLHKKEIKNNEIGKKKSSFGISSIDYCQNDTDAQAKTPMISFCSLCFRPKKAPRHLRCASPSLIDAGVVCSLRSPITSGAIRTVDVLLATNLFNVSARNGDGLTATQLSRNAGYDRIAAILDDRQASEAGDSHELDHYAGGGEVQAGEGLDHERPRNDSAFDSKSRKIPLQQQRDSPPSDNDNNDTKSTNENEEETKERRLLSRIDVDASSSSPQPSGIMQQLIRGGGFCSAARLPTSSFMMSLRGAEPICVLRETIVYSLISNHVSPKRNTPELFLPKEFRRLTRILVLLVRGIGEMAAMAIYIAAFLSLLAFQSKRTRSRIWLLVVVYSIGAIFALRICEIFGVFQRDWRQFPGYGTRKEQTFSHTIVLFVSLLHLSALESYRSKRNNRSFGYYLKLHPTLTSSLLWVAALAIMLLALVGRPALLRLGYILSSSLIIMVHFFARNPGQSVFRAWPLVVAYSVEKPDILCVLRHFDDIAVSLPKLARRSSVHEWRGKQLSEEELRPFLLPRTESGNNGGDDDDDDDDDTYHPPSPGALDQGSMVGEKAEAERGQTEGKDDKQYAERKKRGRQRGSNVVHNTGIWVYEKAMIESAVLSVLLMALARHNIVSVVVFLLLAAYSLRVWASETMLKYAWMSLELTVFAAILFQYVILAGPPPASQSSESEYDTLADFYGDNYNRFFLLGTYSPGQLLWDIAAFFFLAIASRSVATTRHRDLRHSSMGSSAAAPEEGQINKTVKTATTAKYVTLLLTSDRAAAVLLIAIIALTGVSVLSLPVVLFALSVALAAKDLHEHLDDFSEEREQHVLFDGDIGNAAVQQQQQQEEEEEEEQEETASSSSRNRDYKQGDDRKDRGDHDRASSSSVAASLSFLRRKVTEYIGRQHASKRLMYWELCQAYNFAVLLLLLLYQMPFAPDTLQNNGKSTVDWLEILGLTKFDSLICDWMATLFLLPDYGNVFVRYAHHTLCRRSRSKLSAQREGVRVQKIYRRAQESIRSSLKALEAAQHLADKTDLDLDDFEEHAIQSKDKRSAFESEGGDAADGSMHK
eukprot:jgi/Bigna1/78537/fgenesh1_pg.55_\